MSSVNLSYHAGQMSLERNTFYSIKKVRKLLQDRKAMIVPAKYGRNAVYVPDANDIIIIDRYWNRVIAFSKPADFYQDLLKKASTTLEQPYKIKEFRSKKIFYSFDGLVIHTTKSGKTITKIQAPPRG